MMMALTARAPLFLRWVRQAILALCVWIGPLVYFEQVESIWASVEFPKALKSSVEEITKEHFAVEQQFALIIEDGFPLLAVEHFENITGEFCGFLMAHDNFQRAVDGDHGPIFEAHRIEFYAVHNAFHDSRGISVISQAIGDCWRGEHVTVRHCGMKNGTLEYVFQIGFLYNGVEMRALGIHDCLGTELRRIGGGPGDFVGAGQEEYLDAGNYYQGQREGGEPPSIISNSFIRQFWNSNAGGAFFGAGMALLYCLMIWRWQR